MTYASTGVTELSVILSVKMKYCRSFAVFGCFFLSLLQNPPAAHSGSPYNILSNTYCGKQHTDDYDYKGNDTSVDEFPWMVYVIHRRNFLNDNNKFEANVGVIISRKHVLTEKREVRTELCPSNMTNVCHTTLGSGIAVRLGQHHISKDINCIPTIYSQDDCTDPALVIPVIEQFTRENSIIALLRLNRTIIFDNFIRPICLPFAQFKLPRVQEGGIVLTSGWGTEFFIDNGRIQLKKRIEHRVLDDNSCEQGNPIQHPICALTPENSTTFVCAEDNGGPMMYKSRKNTWLIEGVITEATDCVKDEPVNAEKITEETLDWIQDKIIE